MDQLVGFKVIEEDQCMYLKKSRKSIIKLSLYVNNILIIGNDKTFIETTKARCSSHFVMMGMGEAHYVLKVEITRDRSNKLLSLSQKTFIKKVLERLQMSKMQTHR